MIIGKADPWSKPWLYIKTDVVVRWLGKMLYQSPEKDTLLNERRQ